MTMSGANVLNPHPTEFEQFLYASVGEDRNGYGVTVLSALARLGVDPWKETAELVMLGKDSARRRLEVLLSRIRDIPALGSDIGTVAQELSLLLPEHPTTRTLKQAASTVAVGRWGSSGAILTILAIVLVLLQILIIGAPGPGE